MSKDAIPNYRVTDLGTLTNPQAINNFGQIVGYTCGDSPQAVLWQPDAENGPSGRLYALETLGGPASYAIGINDLGHIIAYDLDGSGAPQVTLWTPTQNNFTPPGLALVSLSFPPLQGAQFDPASLQGGINNLGDVATNAGPFSHAALSYPPPGSPPIQFDNIGFYYVAAINDHGWLTGSRVSQKDKALRAYCYMTPAPWTAGGQLDDRYSRWCFDGTPQGANGAGLAITDVNAAGQAAIAFSANDERGNGQAGLWVLPDDKPFFIFDKPRPAFGNKLVSQSYAYGINNLWQVVGWNITDSAAFLYDSNTDQAVDLNKLIVPPMLEKWLLTQAVDINDQGQIIGTGTHNGIVAAFLLTPTFMA